MGRALAISGLLLLTACGPELGACDPSEAIRVAYDEATGMPAYEGQAVMHASCGYGSFCHASDVPMENRLGVPAHLTFDVQLAATDGTVDEAAIARLRRARFRTVQEARGIYESLALGTMPPAGEEGASVRSGAPRYLASDDRGELVPLPGADTPAGREIVRNWLACDAPVVERPLPREDGLSAVVVPPLPRDPIEPTWESVFEDLLRARGCAGARCHGGSEAGFQVTDAAGTRAALVGAEASGDECAGMPLVAPGAPDDSLFYRKLAARDEADVCGDPMPLGAPRLNDDDLAAVRAWIESLE